MPQAPQLTKPDWSFRLANERRVGSRRPAIVGDRVYVVMTYEKRNFTDSTLLAFDLRDGKQLWSYTIQHVGNEPVVAKDHTVYWSSFEGNVYAIDRDGKVMWKKPGTNTNMGVPVLVDDDKLAVSQLGGTDARTWCLKRSTGDTVWTYPHGGHGYPLWVDGGRIFHSSAAPTLSSQPTRCSLFGLAAVDGRRLWSVTDTLYFFNPLVVDGQLYVCSNQELRAYSAGEGKPLASLQLEETRTTLRLAPYMNGDRLLIVKDDHFGSSHSLRALRVEGRQPLSFSVLWSIDEPRGFCEAPIALDNETLLYLTKEGAVCIIESATGKTLAETNLKTQAGMFGGSCLHGNQLVVAHGRDVLKFSL